MRLNPLSSLFILILLFLAACTKPLPHLDGIDKSTWETDKKGCAGTRWQMLPAIESNKDKLLALSEVDLVTLLGKPDEEELYKRNQKFYYYYLQPSSACATWKEGAPVRLVVRFNAVGLAREVTVE